MAEESDLSRTEPASPRRLQQARSEGDVPRSAELTAWVVLLSVLAGLAGWAPHLAGELAQMLRVAFQSAAQPLPAHPFDIFSPAFNAVLPLLGLIFVALLLAPMLLSGWVFAPRVLQFNGTRLNPLAALKRLFSLDGLYAMARTLIKFALVGAACWMVLSSQFEQLFALPGHAPRTSLSMASGLLMKGLLTVAGTLAALALIDGGWQWWRYRARHAMTWQEVLAEARESEASPEMRARMRDRQHAVGRDASPLAEGDGANPMQRANPLPNPLPGAEGTNVMPRAIKE